MPLNRKEMQKKKKHLGLSEMKKEQWRAKKKKKVSTIDFLEFSNLCLTVKPKIIAVADVVLKVHRENISILLYTGEDKGMSREVKFLNFT